MNLPKFYKSKLITFRSFDDQPREIKKFNFRAMVRARSEENRRKLCANLKSNPLIFHIVIFFINHRHKRQFFLIFLPPSLRNNSEKRLREEIKAHCPAALN